MNDKELFFEKFNNGLHRIGRLTMLLGIVLLITVPFFISFNYDAPVSLSGFLAGILNVGILYIPIGIVEFLVYSPMLGAGGSYISFITGNVTNMKIPCAMNAREMAGTAVGTPENEIISTISTATSAIVTTLVIVIGVILLVPLQPVLENPMVKPAFDYVVPALFGALAMKYFSKSLKIAVIPVTLIAVLCICVPSVTSQTGILMIPSGALALAIGFLLFKKGKL